MIKIPKYSSKTKKYQSILNLAKTFKEQEVTLKSTLISSGILLSLDNLEKNEGVNILEIDLSKARGDIYKEVASIFDLNNQ